MNLQERLRVGHVRRWHVVAVAREQTVAEHMHRVAVISEEILRMLGVFSWSDNLTLNVMRWAFLHDRHEVALGDIPTPAKQALRATEYRRITGLTNSNSVPWLDLTAATAATIDPEAEELRACVESHGQCPLAGDIVKYADTLEAMNYLGIFGCGGHAEMVWRDLRQSAQRCYARLALRLRQEDPDEERFTDCAVKTLEVFLSTLVEGSQFK